MQDETVLLFVSGVMPLMRPHAAIYSVDTGHQLESLNSSVVSAGNGRRSSRMTPAQPLTSDAQDVAKRWKMFCFTCMSMLIFEEGPGSYANCGCDISCSLKCHVMSGMLLSL